ncbi:VDPP4 peptidase, partial [Acromyrmex heyeri]
SEFFQPHQLLILFAFVIVIGQSRTVPNNNDTDIHNKDEIELRKPFFLEEIYLYTYYMSGFNGSWISDNEFMVESITGDIGIIDVKTKETKQIFNGTNLSVPYKFNTATISADKQYILFSYNSRRVFRHSTIKNYVVYDIQNLFLDKLDCETTRGLHSEFLTFRFPNETINVNVIGSSLCDRFQRHMRARAREIKLFNYNYFLLVSENFSSVGTPNPVVSLSVIDLFDPLSEAVTLEAPINEVTSDNILYIVSWWNKTHVLATWTNRVQNQSQMTMYDIQGDAKLVLSDEETEGWLQPNLPIRTRDYILLLRREPSGTSAGKFRHINRYEYKDGQFIMPLDLTPGPSEVHAILAADSPRGKVYYLATAPGEPSQRNLYSVPLDGSQKPTCISCKLLTPEGNKCTYATASFSSRRSYYAFTCSGPDPTTVTINDNNHQTVLTWNTNQGTRTLLSRRLIPQRKDFNITVNGYDCRVRLFLPPDFDESKSYPMMVFVYGGPNTVRIVDDAKYGYEHYLTTNRSMVHAWIDGRGSAFKGSNMLFEIYRKIGTVEIEDTIAVTEILQKQYSWIDANRTGIWGWSYGGFTTGMVMARDTNFVFKCGISVAPVTSWIYYDSIYTERLMGLPTPEDNLDGYNRTDISRLSEGIRGKKYMLIHGTGDDNVHYQQALALAKSLEHKDILFEQVTYTDEAHSLENVSPHLYHTMDKFWCECFGWDH